MSNAHLSVSLHGYHLIITNTISYITSAMSDVGMTTEIDVHGAERQYAYFRDLEQLTKSGLAAYTFMLLLGSVTATVGPEAIFHFAVNSRLCERLLAALVTVNVLYVIVRAVGAIHWLGELHVWLDRAFFRFLPKSNRIVMSEIAGLLEPHERAAFEDRSIRTRTTITQSILTLLADDQSIFESLLQRGIFRSWIWYWITLYGVVVFLLLTIVSVVTYLLLPNAATRAFSFSIGIVTGIHFFIGLGMGYNIVFVTKRIVREIVHLHRFAIASLLRNHVERNGHQSS